MSDKPIIFSAPMVRALLDGRKSQTRRILKYQPELLDTGRWHIHNPHGGVFGVEQQDVGDVAVDYVPWFEGQRLWVREAWAPLSAITQNDPGVQALADNGFYRADDSTVEGEISRCHPSIHMPRWASRLTLMVIDVRVERLQGISEDEAKAEGIGEPYLGDGDPPFEERAVVVSRWMQFRNLWNHLHGAAAWDANPWVAAITFETIRANIDSLSARAA